MKSVTSKFDQLTPPVIMKVLIVEDDEPCFIYLKEIFEMNGIQFYHVKNGFDAVDIVSKHLDIKLILMDIELPGMDGLETARRIKGLKPEISIMAESAYSSPEDLSRAYEAGCCDYIIKPFSVGYLLDKINKFHKL